jgi:hypothetical protein
LPDGTTTTEISVDFQGMPIPERRYVADVAWVDFGNEVVRFMFGQRAINGSDQLRSLVLVKVYPEPARGLIERSAPFIRNIKDFLARNNIPVHEVQQLVEEPAQTVALTANMMSITFAGREAEWDFFHLPPSGMRKLSERSDIVVDPVVRIDLATSSLAAIINRLEQLVPELPEEAK